MSNSTSPERSDGTPPPFWSDLLGSFRGVRHDFTSGSIRRAIALLAIPMILEMLAQSLFGIIDIYFVGKVSENAVAAVGMIDSLLVIVYTVGMGLSMAATAVVARRIGEQNPEAASQAAFQVLVLGLFFSIPIAILGVIYAPDLMHLMGAEEAVVAEGASYASIIFGTNILILYLFIINAIFRGAGDAVMAMVVLWIANAINIALDPLFIFGLGPIPELGIHHQLVPAMGVKGAAIATCIGRGVGVILQVILLLRGVGRIQLLMQTLKVKVEVMKSMIAIALPGTLQYFIGSASWIFIFRIIALFGTEAVAGYTIAIRIFIFALLPSWGMGNAAATLVGQNLGARKPDRAERSVWITAYTNAVFLGVVALGIFLFAYPLVEIFSDVPAVVEFGANCLRIVCVTYIFFAFGMVIVQAFNGAGDTRSPTWINLISYWVLQIPLAYILSSTLDLGANGVFIAIAIAQGFLALISILWFRRGSWKGVAA